MEAQRRKRTALTVLWSVAATLAVILVVLLAVPFTGVVDVAATGDHSPLVHWYLETTQKRSVAARTGEIQPSGDLSSPQRIQRPRRATATKKATIIATTRMAITATDHVGHPVARPRHVLAGPPPLPASASASARAGPPGSGCRRGRRA